MPCSVGDQVSLALNGVQVRDAEERLVKVDADRVEKGEQLRVAHQGPTEDAADYAALRIAKRLSFTDKL